MYTFNDKWNVATRADYVRDPDGARTFHAPSSAPFFNALPDDAQFGQELCSVTLTISFKPVEALKLVPEFRWDHSALVNAPHGTAGAFDGHDTQVTLGLGAVYSY